MSTTDQPNAADRGSELTDRLGPLPERWLCVRDNDAMPVSVWRAFQVRDYARAEVARAVAAERERWRAELAYAEAALADIGDADREPGDDMAWCEARAAASLPRVRAALKA